MNAYVVRRATQGLSDFLSPSRRKGTRRCQSRTIPGCIRIHSRWKTALVRAYNGIHAYLFESLRAVPQLSFAIRHLGCIAGVVVTASHNPPAYNGIRFTGSTVGSLPPPRRTRCLPPWPAWTILTPPPWIAGKRLKKGF
jgi:phosphoglucomutase